MIFKFVNNFKANYLSSWAPPNQ